jgi:ribonuclease E
MLEPEQGAESADRSTTEEAAAPRRRRTTRKKVAAAEPEAVATEAPAAEPAPAKKTTRKRTTKKAAAPEADVPLVDLPAAETTAETTAEPAEPAEKPARRTRTRKAAAKAETAPETAPETGTETGTEPTLEPAPQRESRSARKTPAVTFQQPSLLFQPPEFEAEPAPAATATKAAKTTRATKAAKAAEPEPEPEVAKVTPDDSDDAESEEGTSRRRRRRGGRRRGRNGEDEGTETSEESAEAPAEAEAEDDSADEGTEDGEGTGSRRRRRRRRRKGEPVDGAPDDPEVTVVKVREPRKSDNEVTSVEGSTRLEAKKQRRREGREAGRRRPPILTESEFLARREAVDRTMVIRQHHDRTQIAVLEDDVLVEHYVAKEAQTSLIGNVYLGRVQNVLPSMEAAFIDIGRGRNAVLYAGEVDWDGLGLSGQPKRIEMALKSGQQVLVQVTKDPVGHKGARLTSQISLPGRYLVYVPHGSMNGISRKLPDTERNRLKTLLKDIVPDEAGVVVRTAAEGASEEELTRDVARLTAQWESIEKKASNGSSAPELLYAEPELLIKVVRDLFTEDFTKLVVVGEQAWDMVEGYVSHVAPHLSDRLERWNAPEDAFVSFRIDEQIVKALDRKVWLPSGGSLVIDRTEAMTVVDVNTGKFTGAGGNLEETVTKNNLEAAEEIVRQLRLRDIGGIIVVDFIDMVLESNRDLVLRRLVECLGRDRTKHQVAEVTSLGLVQMTRKRIGTGLLEAFSEPCEVCNGRGIKVHVDLATSSAAAPPDEEGGGRRSRRRRRGGGGAAQPGADEAVETQEAVEASDEPDPDEPTELPTPREEEDAGSVADAVEPDVEEVPTRSRRRGRKRVAAAAK